MEWLMIFTIAYTGLAGGQDLDIVIKQRFATNEACLAGIQLEIETMPPLENFEVIPDLIGKCLLVFPPPK